MTMGPAPMIRIDLMSVRLGMGKIRPAGGLREKPGGKTRPVALNDSGVRLRAPYRERGGGGNPGIATRCAKEGGPRRSSTLLAAGLLRHLRQQLVHRGDPTGEIALDARIAGRFEMAAGSVERGAAIADQGRVSAAIAEFDKGFTKLPFG